jgi:hypothetical protein
MPWIKLEEQQPTPKMPTRIFAIETASLRPALPPLGFGKNG